MQRAHRQNKRCGLLPSRHWTKGKLITVSLSSLKMAPTGKTFLPVEPQGCKDWLWPCHRVLEKVKSGWLAKEWGTVPCPPGSTQAWPQIRSCEVNAYVPGLQRGQVVSPSAEPSPVSFSTNAGWVTWRGYVVSKGYGLKRSCILMYPFRKTTFSLFSFFFF